MRDGNVYRCGPFELDADTRRLFRDSRPVWIPERQMDVLLALVSHPGHILTKRELTDAAWRDLAVTDNSIVQAVHGLRETLGSQPDGRPYIKTHMRKGYQFIAPIQRGQSPASLVALDAVVAPHLALGDSRAALETLSLDAIRGARPKYAEIVRAVPSNPRGYVGMATADVLLFESTRADGAPDVAALQRSHHTALEACHRNPKSGAAWRTLAFVLHRSITFLTDLETLVAQFEDAIRQCDVSREENTAARAHIKAALQSGFAAVRELEAMLANHLHDDPVTLEVWERERRVDYPRRGKNVAVAPAPAPVPAAATPVAAAATSGGTT